MIIQIKLKHYNTIGILELVIQSCVMFLALFNPPILNFNCIHIIALFSWFYILVNYRCINLCLRVDKIIKVYFALIILGVYQICIALIANNSIVIASSYVFWTLEVIPYGIALVIHFFKHNYKFRDLFKVIMGGSLIEAFLAIAALISPSIKNIFLQRIAEYGYEASVEGNLSYFRNYGFADSLNFASSIVLAIIAVLCFYQLVTSKKIGYFIVFALDAFTSIINTRTSIVVLTLGVILILFAVKGAQNIIRYIVWLFILIGVFLIGLRIINKYNDWTYDWIMAGINQIFAFIKKDTNNYGDYFNYVSSSSTFALPKGAWTFFGMGTEIMHSELHGVQSDVGYVNDIWRIGLLASIVIYLLYYYAISEFKRLYVIDSMSGNFFFWFFLLAAVVINIKGYFFVYNNITTLLWIVFLFCCCQYDSWLEGSELNE